MTMIVFSDRSRILEYQRCPRARYLGYQWGGLGLRRVRASIPLSTGIFVHAGLAFLLAQLVGVEDWRSVKLDVDGAVKVAVEGYKEVVKARGLDVELGEDAQYVVDEQVALTEALIRVYVLAPEGLAQLMQQYKVL